jgi:hypothetical protein
MIASQNRKEARQMPVSPKKRASNDRYSQKCDIIYLKPIKERGASIRAAAAEAGQSLQGYILQAVEERMAREAQQGREDP